ncbi:MAG: hypothetical protein HXX15_01015 [Rhodopseudomonas sp.]|nr:hypothetical protein [Rhodopseudomonas sp.]
MGGLGIPDADASGYFFAQVRAMLLKLGPHLAVMTPLSTESVSLNLALAEPMQIAETSVSSASQAVGQPFAEHEFDVTERSEVPPTPSFPGGPGGPAIPGSPLGPGVPDPSLQPASATVAVSNIINVGKRIPYSLVIRGCRTSL